MSCITKEEMAKCHAIIHGFSTAAAGAGTGLAQLPCSDSAVIVPLQVAMIIALGEVFHARVDESTAAGIAMSSTGTLVGRGLSQLLVGWIPGFGNAVNAATAAAVTEAMGWAAVNEFTADAA